MSGKKYFLKYLCTYFYHILLYIDIYAHQVIFNQGLGTYESVTALVNTSYTQCLNRFKGYIGHANTMVYKRRVSMCYMHFVCGTFEYEQEPGSVLAHRPMIEAKDCLELYEQGWHEDGIYTIKPVGGSCIQTWCDMTNGGWTVLQRRMDGRENFYRPWEDYIRGFGHASGEYWLGLENIYELSIIHSSLAIEMEAFEKGFPPNASATYEHFRIDDESSNFRLHINGFYGNCGDSFAYQNGNMFTTKDRDNDQYEEDNCAQVYEGAWWYNGCHYSNLNGRYLYGNHSTYANGINWYTCWGYHQSIRKTVMKVRRN